MSRSRRRARRRTPSSRHPGAVFDDGMVYEVLVYVGRLPRRSGSRAPGTATWSKIPSWDTSSGISPIGGLLRRVSSCSTCGTTARAVREWGAAGHSYSRSFARCCRRASLIAYSSPGGVTGVGPVVGSELAFVVIVVQGVGRQRVILAAEGEGDIKRLLVRHGFASMRVEHRSQAGQTVARYLSRSSCMGPSTSGAAVFSTGTGALPPG